jgi:hypothetical protein
LAVPLIDPNEISDWESSGKSVAMFTLSYWHSSCLNSPHFNRLDGVISSKLCVWLIVAYYSKHFIVKLN